MDILFDYQAFEMQRFGGVSHSYAELIKHLRKEGCKCLTGLKESDNEYIKEDGLKPLHYTYKKWFEGEKWFKGQRTLTRKVMAVMGYYNDGLTINKDYCIHTLNRQQFDIFEPTFFDPYFLPYLKGKPFVLTVHDMIPELFPQYFPEDDPQIIQKRLLCLRANHIHVPSQKTKEDLVNILNIAPVKITVIPHGRPDFIVDDYAAQPIFDFPYLLFVGNRSGYKNFSRFIIEYSSFVEKYPEVRVVCTGKEFSEDEKDLFLRLGIVKNVLHCYADDESLRNMYHYAAAFVFPSAYEGFGLPILEAFTSECPVLLNNESCFPEVAEDAAVYFDINKTGDLCEKLVDFYSSGDSLRKEMIKKGKKQAEKYSWEKSAQLLKNVYESLL